MDIERAKEAAEKEGKAYKPPRKKSEAELKKEKFADILHSYLMVSDYIHIPSKNIHLHVEDDIKSTSIFCQILNKNDNIFGIRKHR